MNRKKSIALFSFICASTVLGMDFGALHRQTTQALEEEPVPAGQVILVSQEGKEFQLPQNVAQQSETLNEMLADIGAGRKIFLNNISSQVLEKIVNLLTSLHAHQDLSDKALLDVLEKDVAITDPFTILAAANYLDIQPIMELATRLIAQQEIAKRKGRFFTTHEGPLSKETHDKLFNLFGNDKSRIIPLISRYFFLLSGKNFTDARFDSYHYSIQDYLDYSPEDDRPKVYRSFSVSQGMANNDLQILLSVNINNLKGLSSISGIKKGKKLNIIYAPSLSEIPEHIFIDLADLEDLYINNSNLQVIPVNALKYLRNLKTLGLTGSKIKEIPSNIAELNGLQSLYLYNNEIQAIPDSIALLTNLSVINLNSNKISSIPKIIATLTKLTRIDLANNRITHIDQETINAIAQLPLLQILNLQDNPLDDQTKKALRDTLGHKAFFRD